MKYPVNSIYLLLCTLLALSSCTQEEDVPVVSDKADGERIIFRMSLPGISSRATVLYEDNIPYFHVSAFNPADTKLVDGTDLKLHFNNQRIDITEGTEKFSSDSCIWPRQRHESDEVTFFAFYPELNEGANLENASTLTGNTPVFDYKLTGFRVKHDIADQIDFVTACTRGNMADNLFSGITLPFRHQLSRIEVKAWSANQSCDIEIAGVRIGGVGVAGTFAFKADATTGKLEVEKGGGYWDETTIERGMVEYIFSEEDTIVYLEHGTTADTSTTDGAVSIMGSRNGDDENCSMLIPYDYSEWNYKEKPGNGEGHSEGMFISVLLRVTDATLTAGKDPEEPQRFPYKDNSQGANSLNARNIPVVYLAVDKSTGKVTKRLYKNGDNYYTGDTPTDETLYTLSADEEVKDFGWATLPVTGKWEPGNIYTYTLNYTYGVGLHGPEIKEDSTNPDATPKAGDPIISDKVGINYSVKEWKIGGGSEFTVPGS